MAFNLSSQSADVIPGAGFTSTGSSKIVKVVKSLRLIRLIRIIKLYKYAVKTNTEAEEAKLKEQQKLSANAQQAILKRELEPSRLGNALSDTTTRRVIIGVLGMLMILPLLTYTNDDFSSEFGIRELFWYGRSDCSLYNGTFFCERGGWLTQQGWEEKLRQFIVSARGVETDDLARTVLWMYLPDFQNNGTMDIIQNVTTRDGTGLYWQ